MQAYTIIHCDSRNNIPNGSTLITTSGQKYVHLNKTECCKFYRGKDYIRKSMVAVTNEVFKCFFINTKILSRSWQWFIGEGIPSVFQCTFLDIIQYHVSRVQHQNMLCILGETSFVVLRRYILLIRPFSKVDINYRFFCLQKSSMPENSVCHC